MNVFLFWLQILTMFLLVSVPFVLPIVFCLCRNTTAENDRYCILDKIGIITNIIFSLLYLPLSIWGSLFGMVGEGYMYTASAAQTFLIRVIEIFAFLSPVIAVESILSSVVLRNHGWHRSSFVIQFGLVFYLIFILALIFVLEYI